jgi:hypothetical protein
MARSDDDMYLPADLQELIERRKAARGAVSAVAAFMAEAGYTADDLAADLADGGSVSIFAAPDEDALYDDEERPR